MKKIKKTIFTTGLVILSLWYVINLETVAIFLDRTIGTDLATNPYKPFANMKFILLWTNSNQEPFIYMGRGQFTFVKRRCSIDTCYVTSDRNLLGSVRKFDAVLFNGQDMATAFDKVPKRHSDQKYVFVSTEPSYNYLKSSLYDGFFNWTWTYRLNSDIYFGYIVIKNKKQDIIGPKEIMYWPKVEAMKPISNKTKQKLEHKKTAAAWFVTRCVVRSKRHIVGRRLQLELSKYNLTLDVYGVCGDKYCPRYYMKECLQYLERKYYFYLAFESAMDEDYVTEKILHALQHYTVPIVYGGANYTRFMPKGSYLVARPNNIETLAKQMADLIKDKTKYYDYFRWTNYYTYHYPEESPETDYYCNLCQKLHDVNLMEERSSQNNFVQWWNPEKNIESKKNRK